MDLRNAYGVVLAVSLDDAPLAGSRRTLLVAGGNAVNTGMVRQWGGGRLAAGGEAPILVEPVVGSVSLPADGPRTVWALDDERDHRVQAEVAGGRVRFSLAAADKTLDYEIVAADGGR